MNIINYNSKNENQFFIQFSTVLNKHGSKTEGGGLHILNRKKAELLVSSILICIKE